MFGEEYLKGQSEAKFDQKGRMIIPIWTKREEGDNLVCIKDERLNLYRIYNGKIIDSYIKKFEEIKLKCITIEDLETIKKIELEFYKSIISTAKLDKQGRFMINDNELKGKTVKIIGAGNNLILEHKI